LVEAGGVELFGRGAGKVGLEGLEALVWPWAAGAGGGAGFADHGLSFELCGVGLAETGHAVDAGVFGALWGEGGEELFDCVELGFLLEDGVVSNFYLVCCCGV
jgi:hypothetical protein